MPLCCRLEYNSRECAAKYAAVAEAWDVDLGGKTVEKGAQEAISMVKRLAADIQIPSLRDMGVTAALIPQLARDSMGPFSNNNSNPVFLGISDVAEVLARAIA